MDAKRLAEMEGELCALFAAHLGVSQPSLERALKKAGRRLPSKQQKNGVMIADSIKRAEHPLLQTQSDDAALERAHGQLKQHLQGIDRKSQQMTSVIRVTAGLAFNLLVLVALVILVLRWRGIV